MRPKVLADGPASADVRASAGSPARRAFRRRPASFRRGAPSRRLPRVGATDCPRWPRPAPAGRSHREPQAVSPSCPRGCVLHEIQYRQQFRRLQGRGLPGIAAAGLQLRQRHFFLLDLFFAESFDQIPPLVDVLLQTQLFPLAGGQRLQPRRVGRHQLLQPGIALDHFAQVPIGRLFFCRKLPKRLDILLQPRDPRRSSA